MSSVASDDPFTTTALDAALRGAATQEGTKQLAHSSPLPAASWAVASLPSVSADAETERGADEPLFSPDFAALDGSNALLLGVLDGRGDAGANVADFVKRTLPTQIISVSNGASLSEAFLRTDELLHGSGLAGLGRSGAATTLLALCISDASCRIACLGNIRVLLGRREAVGAPLSVEQLSAVHTPAAREEYERCQLSGARVMSALQLEKRRAYHGSWERDVAPLGDRASGDESPRLYAPDREAPGTELTRCFGERVAKGLGVIAEPEVRTLQPDTSHRYLLIATASVFECLSIDEALAIAASAAERPGGSLRAGCLAVVAEAARQALRQDDFAAAATVALLRLEWDGEGPPTLEVSGSVSEPSNPPSEMGFSWMGDYDLSMSNRTSPRNTAPPSHVDSPCVTPPPSTDPTAPPSPMPTPQLLRPKPANAPADGTTRLPLTLTSTRRAPYVPPPGIGSARAMPPPPVAPAEEPPASPRSSADSARRSKSAPPVKLMETKESKASREPKRRTTRPWARKSVEKNPMTPPPMPPRLGLLEETTPVGRTNSATSESFSARLNPDLPLPTPRALALGSPCGRPLSPVADSSPSSGRAPPVRSMGAAMGEQGSPAAARAIAAAVSLVQPHDVAATRGKGGGVLSQSLTSDGEEDSPSGPPLVRSVTSNAMRLGCFLKRCGILRKVWKTRWAALDGGSFYYFSDSAYSICRGVLPLDEAVIEEELFDGASAPRGFGPCPGFRIMAMGRTLRGFPHLGIGAQTGDAGIDTKLWLEKLHAAAANSARPSVDTGPAERLASTPEMLAKPVTRPSAGSAPKPRQSDSGAVEPPLAPITSDSNDSDGRVLPKDAGACDANGCRVADSAIANDVAQLSAESEPAEAPVKATFADVSEKLHKVSKELAESERTVAEIREELAARMCVEAALRDELAAARAANNEREAEWRRREASLLERIEAGRAVETELRAQLSDAHDEVARARLASPRSRSLSPRASSTNLNRGSYRGTTGRVALVKSAFETGTRVTTPRDPK